MAMNKQSWDIEEVNEAIAKQRMVGQEMMDLEAQVKATAKQITESGVFAIGATTRSVQETFDRINETVNKVGAKYVIVSDKVDALNVRADEINRNNMAGAVEQASEEAKAKTRFQA